MAKKSAYASAGVDLEVSNRLKDDLPTLLASTKRPEVLGEVGGFGGLFALNTRKYRNPVLVSSVDGVGTKLKVAFAARRHDTIGQDLVNHCVNDIAVLGAEPLFFLDYIGTGKLQKKAFADIVRGFAIGCRENNCSLVGGETAQMPGFYQPGEYDVSGTIVGVVEKNRILDGSTVWPGDKIIGIAASGLHTNGYSLARNILFDKMKLKPSSRIPRAWYQGGGRTTQGARQLRAGCPKAAQEIQQGCASFVGGEGLAHITGGGFIDNIPRVLPENCNAVILRGTWDVLPIYEVLQAKGKVSETEMHQVFNMGIGMIAIVDEESAKGVLRTIRANGHKAWEIGLIDSGTSKVQLA